MAHVEYPSAIIEEARSMGVQLGSGEEYDPSDALETLGQEMQVSASMHGDVAGLRFAGEELIDIGCFGSEDSFGGFSFKKLGRGIGKGLKKVGKVAGKVVRNPVVQAMNPAAAIAIHTTKKAATGKGTIKGPLGKVVDAGSSVVMSRVNVASVIGKNPMAALGKSIPLPRALPKIVPKAVVSSVKKTVRGSGVLSFGVQSTASIKGAMSAADRLLGDPKVKNAALVVRNTQALAALGDANAKRGLAVLSAVGTIRQVKKAPPGKAVVKPVPIKTPVVQTTSPARVTALAQATAAKKAADEANKTWVDKVLGWFGLETKR